MSGSFFLNHEGKWVVKSKSNYNFKISHVITANYPIFVNSRSSQLERAITSFSIITDDGVKYVFGQSNSAIEFSYGQSTLMYAQQNSFQPNMQISSWYLIQIVAPTGQAVNFNYSKYWSGSSYSTSSINDPVVPGSSFGSLPILTDINYPRRVAIYASILESIESNNGVSIVFNKSISQQNLPQGPAVPNAVVPQGTPLGTAPVNEAFQFFQLDGLQKKVNNSVVDNISFTYLKVAGVRNKLEKIKYLSTDGQKSMGEYSFEYNAKNLPAITSVLEDHWGYYNGKRYWDILYLGAPAKPLPDETGYYESREADADFMDAEILTRMKYPAGGFIDFLFEPNQYSKAVKLNENSLATNLPQLLIENQGSNKIGGGLRIKKISKYESPSSLPIVKEYFYNSNSINGGTTSSGILKMKPDYMFSNNFAGVNRTCFNSNAFNIINADSPVTYTEVMEKSNEGYTVSLFANHDNGYLDRAVYNSPMLLNTVNLWYVYRLFSSLDLERGLLLNNKTLDINKTLLKEVNYQYNSDINRYSNCIRTAIDIDPLSDKFIAVPIYTFNPYLKKVLETNYLGGTALTNQKEFEYDTNYRLITSAKDTNSKGEIIKTDYKYCYNLIGVEQSAYMQQLLDSNRIADPIITAAYNGNVKLSEKHTKYENSSATSNLLVPKEIHANTGTSAIDVSSALDRKIVYDKFDNKGNIQQYTMENGISVSNIWGYNKQFLIAKIENATNSQIATALGITSIDTLNESNLNSINSLRNSLSSAMVTTYTYLPHVGMTSITDPKGYITYYEYDAFNHLKSIKDADGNIISNYHYNYKQ
jgi:YD repeat-containing protein